MVMWIYITVQPLPGYRPRRARKFAHIVGDADAICGDDMTCNERIIVPNLHAFALQVLLYFCVHLNRLSDQRLRSATGSRLTAAGAARLERRRGLLTRSVTTPTNTMQEIDDGCTLIRIISARKTDKSERKRYENDL